MANPISVTAALQYTNPSVGIASVLLQEGGTTNQQSFPISGQNYKRLSASASTSPTAIDVSGLANVGWMMVRNLDPANPVLIKTSTSGTTFARVLAGEAPLFRLDSSVTAPAIVALNAPVSYEALLIEY